MKKPLLLAIVSTITSFGTFAQNVNIPDANFKAYLVGNSAINTNADAEIQVSEANAFTGTINCQNLNISDLTGIEVFTSLTSLLCGNNPLGTIDVSQNTALQMFQPHNNNLTSLDVSQNTALVNFVCVNNNLTTLNLSQNTNLNLLSISNNNLTSLDISQNINLGVLACSNNSLTSLDISNNTALYNFNCSSNNLSTLNMKNINSSNLSAFDATSNPNLTCIEVDDVVDATANWTNIDAGVSFSLDCGALSTNDFELSKNISFFPNPGKSHINLSTNENIEYVSIIDVSGKAIKRISSDYKLIDISDLSNGIYFLSINTNNGTAIKKFIRE